MFETRNTQPAPEYWSLQRSCWKTLCPAPQKRHSCFSDQKKNAKWRTQVVRSCSDQIEWQFQALSQEKLNGNYAWRPDAGPARFWTLVYWCLLTMLRRFVYQTGTSALAPDHVISAKISRFFEMFLRLGEDGPSMVTIMWRLWFFPEIPAVSSWTQQRAC